MTPGTTSDLTLDLSALSAEPRHVSAAEAEHLGLTPGEHMNFLQIGDSYTPDIIDAVVPPGEGPPMHSHLWATYEVIIEGTLRVVVDDVEYRLHEGDYLYTPPNARHAFVNDGTIPARVVAMNLPGGFYPLYAEFQKISANGVLDPAAMASTAAKHGARLHGPPLAA